MGVPFWTREEVFVDNLTAWNQDFLDIQNQEQVWDVLVIGAETFPGVCRVEAEPHRRVDRKVEKGSNREKITITGYTASDITIVCKVWTDAQWQALQDVIKEIWPGPTKDKIKPFSIKHKNLEWLGIQFIQITSVSNMKDASEQDAKEITIKGLEYLDLPSVPSKTKPKRAKPPPVNSVNPFKSLPGQTVNKQQPKPSTQEKNFSDPNERNFSG